MIRGKYLRERKAIRFKRRIKLLICILILLILHKLIFSSYSLYESVANSKLTIDAAFFILENKNLSRTVRIDDIEPGEPQTCSFSIANFYSGINEETNEEEQLIAETDMKYNLKIRTTTNLPLEYKIYINDNPQENAEALEQINKNGGTTTTQDEDDTYFKTLLEYTNTFDYGVATTDTYILEVLLPEESADYTCQGMIDVIEITVDAEQV